MANANEQLADVYELLKSHDDLLRSMILDIDGLKATLTGHDREAFDHRYKALDRESAAEHAESLRRFDAIIARLRGQ